MNNGIHYTSLSTFDYVWNFSLKKSIKGNSLSPEECFSLSYIVLGGQIIGEHIMNSGLIWLSWRIHMHKEILVIVFEMFSCYQNVWFYSSSLLILVIFMTRRKRTTFCPYPLILTEQAPNWNQGILCKNIVYVFFQVILVYHILTQLWPP